MEWIESEPFGFGCPDFADVFIPGEAFEGLQPPAKIVGADEVCEMGIELLVAVVVIALDGGFLDGPVHAFDLTIGPWVLDLGEAVLDTALLASHIKRVRHVTRRRTTGVLRREDELDAIVG
jgi:hypothetical protein